MRTNLEIRQLPKDLSTDIALISDFSILPGERVGQGLVANNLPTMFGLPDFQCILSIALSGRGRFRRKAV